MKIISRFLIKIGKTLLLVFYYPIGYFLRKRLNTPAQTDRFFQVNKQFEEICKHFESIEKSSKKNSITPSNYDWISWQEKIRQDFQRAVPLGFLSNKTIRRTMVVGGIRSTKKRLAFISSVLPDRLVTGLLREDFIGLPSIISTKFLTSANRVHHLYHIASYYHAVGNCISSCNTIIEWGGGYGSMARIIRKMHENITYIIIDLPELCALQYIYLFSVEGENSVNLVRNGSSIVKGKINIMMSSDFINEDIELSCQGFISTWALTESPKEFQKLVIDRKFFGANKILLAYSANDGQNYIRDSLDSFGLKLVSISFNTGHEYAFL